MNTPSPTHDPLKPGPRWVYTSGAGWHDSTGRVTHGRTGDPASFVEGFEGGAYALANTLNSILDAGESKPDALVEVVRLLMRYKAGAAHPVAGWQYEPKRS